MQLVKTCSWKIFKTLLQPNIESKCLHNVMRFWDFWEQYLTTTIGLYNIQYNNLFLFNDLSIRRRGFEFKRRFQVNSFVELDFILTVCYYHFMYAFQSESTLYICLNGWVFVYELSCCEFEYCCCHIISKLEKMPKF